MDVRLGTVRVLGFQSTASFQTAFRSQRVQPCHMEPVHNPHPYPSSARPTLSTIPRSHSRDLALEDVGEDTSQGRQAGTHYRSVYFQTGPYGRHRIPPRDVGGL